ncbi:MAG: aminotransferase, partial [Sphingomonadales bacterium]|nr:aminotransferase [Sphingomonadales bacterium]
MALPSQRHLFDIPRDVCYLNAAYMTPLSRAARAAGEVAFGARAAPWTVSPEDFFTGSEELRGLFARLINARADDVALVPAVSYGLATAAANIRLAPGQTILILAEQFPSNV